jgi:hypothetical protein
MIWFKFGKDRSKAVKGKYYLELFKIMKFYNIKVRLI